MSLREFWNDHELYFYHEFIDDPSFPEEKKKKLQQDSGTYFINKDFTIYQEKRYPFDEINQADVHVNFFTFMRILYHLHIPQVHNFLQFHFDKYAGKKIDFLNYVYREFKGSKTTKGGIEQPPCQQKVMLLEWCEEKLNELNSNGVEIVQNEQKVINKNFIHSDRLKALSEIENKNFDLAKLIKLLQEINYNFSFGNYLSVAMLERSVINHIPPIFGFTTFAQVANNYGGQSFKKNMKNLDVSMRSIADTYLHETIQKNEALPNENQVDFSREFDYLLGELLKKLKE